MSITAERSERVAQSWALLVFLFSLANFLEVAIMAHFVLFTPTYFRTIGFDEAQINTWTGPTASLAFLLGIWFVPFWGVLADRHGRKPLILRSYYVEVAAMVLAALSQNLWLYMIGRALTGLALGNTGLMYATVTETAPRNRLALSLGLINGSAPLGSLIGALAGGFIVSAYGVHTLFWIDAAVAVVIALLLQFFYHEPYVRRATRPIREMLADALRAVVHSPVAMIIFILNFIYSASLYFSFTYLPVRVGEIVGAAAAPAAIGITQGAAGLTTLLGSAFWGAVADRAGHRRLLALLLGMVVIIWLPIYAAQSILELGVAWAILNMIGPSVSSIMFAIVSLNLPADKRASVLSMIYLPMNLAFIVGPLAASLVARNLEVRDVFLGSSALALIALLVLILNLGRTRGEENAATE